MAAVFLAGPCKHLKSITTSLVVENSVCIKNVADQNQYTFMKR